MKKVKVAYQGEPGAYSEAAVRAIFKPFTDPTAPVLETDPVGLKSFEAVFKAVTSGEVQFAVVPIENTLGGSIHVNYDLLLQNNDKVHIVGEHNFRVRHCLLALPGVTKADIKKAMSHPQALAQCEHYIQNNGWEICPAYDTAGSAKMIKEQGLKDTAALCSATAAELFGLNILDAGVEDDNNNFTRMLLLRPGKRELRIDQPNLKTTVVMQPPENQPGMLFKVLSVFAIRDIDLTKIESRPMKLGQSLPKDTANGSLTAPSPKRQKTDDACWNYLFYIDFAAGAEDEAGSSALRNLSDITPFVRVLGSYPANSVLVSEIMDSVDSSLSTSPALLPLMKQKQRLSGLRIGIVGFGNFGQFLGQWFVQAGHAVFATSRTDYSAEALNLGVQFTTDPVALLSNRLDVLIFGPSVLSFEKVVQSFPRHLLKDVLVADVLSVKMHAKEVMLRLLPESCDVVCCHPMFGPESGKKSWAGLPCVYELVRVKNHDRGARFLDLWEEQGCRMVQMSCELHDKVSAGSQFITHLTGRLLGKLGLQSTAINTKGFESLLALVDNTAKDSMDLFYALYAHNSNSEEQLSMFSDALDTVRQDLLSASSSGGSTPALKLSARVASLEMSKTVAVTDLASQLRSQGKDVISLSVGEPDFFPPDSVLAAATTAMQSGKTKYTDMAGCLELRKAICKYLQDWKGTTYEPAQILTSNGAKQSILQVLMALCGPGDEVIVPAPYWVSYPSMCKLCGAKAVIINMQPRHGYCLQPEELETAISPRTRVLILCNPSNPTGANHSAEALERLAAVLRRHPHVLVLADEIYEMITYSHGHRAFATYEGMYDRTITVNGFSKGFAMTGFRLGYLAAPLAITKAAAKVQSQNTSCASSIAQYAAIAALEDLTADFKQQITHNFLQKRDYVLQRLAAIPGVECPTPEGAFYVFPSCQSFFGRRTPTGDEIRNAEDVCMYLLREQHVALVPGAAFGAPNCFRISYATGMDTLEKAMNRIAEGLNALH